jgi:hypothetical protein
MLTRLCEDIMLYDYTGKSEDGVLELLPESAEDDDMVVIYCVGCQSMHDEIFKREPRNCWHRSMR